jgi:AhpD family alkylhydroperoxidase
MLKRISLATLATLAAAALIGALEAADPSPTSLPRPVPHTRPEMKQMLEEMKSRKPPIPLPELTAEENERLGDRATSYESRLRYHYLPGGEGRGAAGFGQGRGAASGQFRGTGGGGDFTRNADPNMTLDYRFKTMLFWIVSRTNNCQYCLGHQEQKLAAVGMTEEQLAALDFDWLRFTAAERAGLAYARKLTHEPHTIDDETIASLREHFTDLQILEMSLSIGGNNVLNRWKEGAAIPQSSTGLNFFRRAAVSPPANRPLPIESFLTPTPEEFSNVISTVAVLKRDPATGAASRYAIAERPPLESREVTLKILEACRTRTPRLPVLAEEAARQAVGGAWPAGPMPKWVRLAANFPGEARSRIQSWRTAEERYDLSALLRNQVSWIMARQDRAWYAAGLARQNLLRLGQTDDQIFALDGDWREFSPGERSMFTLARKLAASPVVLTDDDRVEAVRQYGARLVVQMIQFVANRASFHRFTEPAGLPLDE